MSRVLSTCKTSLKGSDSNRACAGASSKTRGSAKTRNSPVDPSASPQALMFSSFSRVNPFWVGCPAPIQPLHLPPIDSAFLELSALGTERNRPPQYKISLVSVSGTPPPADVPMPIRCLPAHPPARISDLRPSRASFTLSRSAAPLESSPSIRRPSTPRSYNPSSANCPR